MTFGVFLQMEVNALYPLPSSCPSLILGSLQCLPQGSAGSLQKFPGQDLPFCHLTWWGQNVPVFPIQVRSVGLEPEKGGGDFK